MRQYRVTELTQILKQAVSGVFPGFIMVQGEVTGISSAASGHIYFSLKDDGAKLKAAYFKNSIRQDSFIPKNGDSVSAIGELRIYEPEGAYQLIVRKVIYSAEGDFWRKFEETKKKLEAEGLFETSRKKMVPHYPRRIALLTAATGAAVKDFVVTSFKGGNFVAVDVWSIPVQGKEAAPKIVKAINSAGGRTDLYQALVLTRGGGSLDDLSVFNDESVARALKGSRVATISAIGHEQDITICDMVADLRTATPTAAAEAVTEYYRMAAPVISNFHNRLSRVLRLRLENVNLCVDSLGSRMRASGASSRLERERLRLNSHIAALMGRLNLYIAARRSMFQLVESRIISPENKLLRLKKRTEELNILLAAAARRRLMSFRHGLDLLSQRLELTDPNRLLSLGYALVYKDDRILMDALCLKTGDEIEIKLNKGTVAAQVKGTKPW